MSSCKQTFHRQEPSLQVFDGASSTVNDIQSRWSEQEFNIPPPDPGGVKLVGSNVGADVGLLVGPDVGALVGSEVGSLVGAKDGMAEGITLNDGCELIEGADDGDSLGLLVG